ncbi:response regulator transcription factor [Paenibacillus sp. 1001270B_150601_E10]|uniref:response regulator transcription factor n=1 Tax=Paenibacillus sp. 1001270B_150601_E10 TaxID=2787079 RepID=UPI00189F70BA|nr:response regulator [Paenibacillus sp. 1001270B_150601_E10]
MYKLLIVDDEGFQRHGIKFLIHKYDLKLDVYEAESGEEALAFIKEHPIDILLTDIRMKELDGLQLVEEIRAQLLPIQVIFMSAYGEFEYAKRAIDLQAVHYILKPVEVSEFLKVFSKVIERCDRDVRQKQDQSRMQGIYDHGLRYEQQRLISRWIHRSALSEEDQLADICEMTSSFESHEELRVVILDARERFFDRINLEALRALEQLIPRKYEWVHLNENQCLLFMEAVHGESKRELERIGQQFIHWFHTHYHMAVYVACSGCVHQIGQLRDVYQEFERILDSKFFYDEGVVFFTGSVSGDEQEPVSVEDMLEEIKREIERRNYPAVQTRFQQLAGQLQENNQVSSIYLKYICMEVLKVLIRASSIKNGEHFRSNLEKIYNTNKLSDLMEHMMSLIEDGVAQDTEADDSGKRVISEVIRIIEREYNRDIAVEELAERVNLSPNYLSHIFKKHQGVSIVKFTTSLRMDKAKYLLHHTNKKIAAISDETGYRNVAYFCSLFKTYYGLTPSQYREQPL